MATAAWYALSLTETFNLYWTVCFDISWLVYTADVHIYLEHTIFLNWHLIQLDLLSEGAEPGLQLMRGFRIWNWPVELRHVVVSRKTPKRFAFYESLTYVLYISQPVVVSECYWLGHMMQFFTSPCKIIKKNR